MMKKNSLPELHPVAGFRLGTTAAGIKTPGRPDLVVMELASGSSCAAVFTQNAFCAAPVVVAREHLLQTQPCCLLINTGNANAGTGESGIRDARSCCEGYGQAGGLYSAGGTAFFNGCDR